MAIRAVLAVLVLTAAFLAPVSRKFDQWKSYGGGVDASQYSSLNQITKNNVKQLTVAWTFQPGGTTNPLIVDGVVYLSRAAAGGGGGRGGRGGGAAAPPVAGAPAAPPPAPAGIVALDGATGKELWFNEGAVGARGMNYWESADRSDRRLIVINGGIKEINAMNGQTITTFGDNGRVDPRLESDRPVSAVGGNPGRVYKDTIIVSLPAGGANYDSTPGDVRAFDVRTGKLKWTFHSVPKPDEFGADTWPAGALAAGHGGVHNWSEFSVDEDNGIAFIPFGTARFDFYGGNRKGNDLFANSLVALDAETGKRLWHFQMVHHDLWDYDLPTAPKLLTVRNNGQNVDIVAQPTKHGFLFVLNRKTGVPLWPINEKPVPQSDVPGEYTSPTQPVPSLPEPFARQSFTEKDINPFMTPEQKEQVRQCLMTARNEGLFTPPSLRGSIELPGHNGGANWGSSAVDPTKGTMYIVSKELPTFLRLVPPAGSSVAAVPAAPCSAAAGGRGGGGGGGGGRGGGAAPAGAPEAAAAGGQGGGGGRGGRGGGGGAPAAAPAPGAGAPQNAAAGGGGRGGGGNAGGGGGRGGGGTPRAYRPDTFVEFASPYEFMQFGASPSGARGMSIMGPPWSQLTAYDLNTGRKIWQVPHGSVTALGDAGKDIGSAAPRGGVIVTAGGLVFAGTASDRKFRAYDADNGKVVWEYDLPGAQEGVPAVYQVAGREYIIVPVGGGSVFQPTAPAANAFPAAGPAQYMVFALPAR